MKRNHRNVVDDLRRYKLFRDVSSQISDYLQFAEQLMEQNINAILSEKLTNKSTLAKKKSPQPDENKSIEIEVRFEHFTNANISANDFIYVLQNMLKLAKTNNWQIIDEIHSTDTIFTINSDGMSFNDLISEKTIIKTTTDGINPKYRWKEKIFNKNNGRFSNDEYGFRIGFAVEKDIAGCRDDICKDNPHERNKQRKTIVIGPINVDFTVISSDIKGKETTYEIEAEINHKDGLYNPYNIDRLSYVCEIILSLIYKTKLLYGLEERNNILEQIAVRLGIFTKNSGQKDGHSDKSKKDKYLKSKKGEKRSVVLLPTIFVNKPKDLLVQDLSINSDFFSEPYAVSIKANGQRVLGFFSQNGIYLFFPPFDLYKISEAIIEDKIGVIFDAEIMPDDEVIINKTNFKFFVFDMLTIHGSDRYDIRDVSYKIRFAAVKQLSDTFADITRNIKFGDDKNNLQIQLLYKKTFIIHDVPSFYNGCKKALETTNDEDIGGIDNMDGLIFTPINKPYLEPNRVITEYEVPCGIRMRNPSRIRKWKPYNKLTIDFKIDKSIIDNVEYISFLCQGDKEFVQFTGNTQHKLNRRIKFADIKLNNELLKEGQIVEFSYDTLIEKFTPLRIRDDKVTPNHICVAQTIWVLLHNPITTDVIKGDDTGVIFMTKYHNRFKRELLEEIRRIATESIGTVEFGETSFPKMNVKLLDIGSGQGPQIHDWIANKFFVTSIEPNPIMRQEFEQRLATKESNDFYTKNKYISWDVNLIAAFGEDYNTIIDGLKKHDQNVTGSLERLKADWKRIIANYKYDEMMKLQYKLIEEKLGLYKKITEKGKFVKFDVVTQFFSLTFFYESDDKVNGLIKTLQSTLKVGGKYYCIALDGNLVLQQFNKGGNFMQLKTNDNAFVLTRVENNPRKIRIRIDKTLVDQEEYLVDFDDFISKLERSGFVLERDEYLTGEQIMAKSGLWFSSMNRLIVVKYVGGTYKYPKALTMIDENVVSLLMSNKSFLTKEGTIKLIKEQIGIFGIPFDKSSFFYSILTCIDDKFRTQKEGKQSAIQKLRIELAKQFTEQDFNTIYQEMVDIKSYNKSTHSYMSVKNGLANYYNCVGLEIRRYIMKQLNINIHIYIMIGEIYKKYYSYLEKKQTIDGGKHIYLLWHGTDNFEPLCFVDKSGKNEFIFASDKNSITETLEKSNNT